MKKFLIVTILILLAAPAFAGDYSFDASKNKNSWDDNGSDRSWNKGGHSSQSKDLKDLARKNDSFNERRANKPHDFFAPANKHSDEYFRPARDKKPKNFIE